MWSWFGGQELTEAVPVQSPWFCCCCKARPGRAGLAVALGCAVLHQWGIRQNFVYVLFTHKSFVLNLTFAYTSLILVVQVAVSPFT